MKTIKLIIFSAFLTVLSFYSSYINAKQIKFYTLDCGLLHVSDMTSLSERGLFDGQRTTMANPCFLIRHPKGDLIWDTGHEESLADEVDGVKRGVWHSTLSQRLTEQLAELQLIPDDIEYLSLSHLHPDHSGNANVFSDSTFIVSEDEKTYMFSEEMQSVFGRFYSTLEEAQTIVFQETYDVFGDGRVVMHTLPGHTPGSAVLLVRLNESGNLILSGDLYIHRKGRELKTLPLSNTDKKATIASRIKLERMIKAESARLIIQHDMQDFKSLPRFPAFLD